MIPRNYSPPVSEAPGPDTRCICQAQHLSLLFVVVVGFSLSPISQPLSATLSVVHVILVGRSYSTASWLLAQCKPSNVGIVNATHDLTLQNGNIDYNPIFNSVWASQLLLLFLSSEAEIIIIIIKKSYHNPKLLLERFLPQLQF